MTTIWTRALVLVVVVIVSGWTLAMSLNGAPDDTVSEVMREWSARWWVVPAAWGALAGHWWGPRVPAWSPRWTGWVLAGLGVVGVALGALQVGAVAAWWAWWIWLALGAVAGAALWPLERGGGA